MPRANRHFLPGYAWHLTHRCHTQEYLLKFARDRQLWRHWLFEARKRYGLCVLNYIATSNHIHLLVQDTGDDAIAMSMQLIAGRTAQAYNQRKERKGAFWEDRYHATAVQTDDHLARCLVYMDLNMVRAGVVAHPRDWQWSGYHELMHPPQRYAITDQAKLMALLGITSLGDLQHTRDQWITDRLGEGQVTREAGWTQSLALGSADFVEDVKEKLGITAKARRIIERDGVHVLKEPAVSYAIDCDAENAVPSNNRPSNSAE